MSYIYDDFGNIKDNCSYVIPTSEPINIRGLRSDANWSIECVKADNKDIEISCVFWTKKQAIDFLNTGIHKCEYTGETLYQIKHDSKLLKTTY